MWPFKKSKQCSPPPSPEYDRPWRSMDWNKDRQNLLTSIQNFQPGNKEVNTLRILLHGPQGAGKSSFFNSVNTALQGRSTTRALAQAVETGRSFTLECKTYKVKDKAGSFYPFTFTDIAGMDHRCGTKTDDIKKFLNGHINNGYIFNPHSSITEDDPKYKKDPTLTDRIHCLVAVLPANTISMMNEDILRQMREVLEKA